MNHFFSINRTPSLDAAWCAYCGSRIRAMETSKMVSRCSLCRGWVSSGVATTVLGHETIGANTTAYPNKFYSIASSTGSGASRSTTTSYIWAGDTLVAYIDQAYSRGTATGSAVTYYVHADHLGSTRVVTNASGTVTQALDYLPYGARRVTAGTDTSQREYIGERFDDGTNLSYFNARYYEGLRGQFLSQDPVFWEIAQTQDGRSILSNPQAMNSYAYAGGNPIKNKDPKGELFVLVVGIPAIAPWVVYTGAVFVGAVAATTVVLQGGVDVLLHDNTYPRPGIDLQTSTLATQNAGKMEPEPNPNWTGGAGIIGFAGLVLNWLRDDASGLGSGPSNADVLRVLYQWANVPQAKNSSNLPKPNYNFHYDQQSFANLKMNTVTPVLEPSSALNGASSNNGGWGAVRSACGTLCQ